MSDNMQFSVPNQDQKKAASFMLSELKFENEKLSGKNREASVELKKTVAENKDLDKKIMFLEKLMIEKDNSIYRFQRKTKEAVN